MHSTKNGGGYLLKLKKIALISVCSLFISDLSYINVSAIDFEKQESKYMSVCQSSSLSKSEQQTCKKFNEYLSEKNKKLKKEIQNINTNIEVSKDNLEEIKQKIETLNQEITQKEQEIIYYQNQISELEKSISEKEEELKDRIYALQSTYNSNMYLEYIFGAENFSDAFARIDAFNEITEYDKDLIKSLLSQKETLNNQKEALDKAKKNLDEQRATQYELQKKQNEYLESQNQALKSANDASAKLAANQKQIDESLAKAFEESQKQESSTNVPQIPGSSGGNSSNISSSELGIKIANKALSKQGCRYWWGAPGGGFGDGQSLSNPNAIYFDCSGLVAWAHRQAGVDIGRNTASGYSRSGKSVSYSNLQIGDVITFNYGSGVAHIGIYIGNQQMVHASGKGSSTRGQYADQCVKVSSIAPGSYYYRYIYNCRRLY